MKYTLDEEDDSPVPATFTLMAFLPPTGNCTAQEMEVADQDPGANKHAEPETVTVEVPRVAPKPEPVVHKESIELGKHHKHHTSTK